jgi:hypothetical protein
MNDWLMDLVQRPFSRGQEEDETGVFFARVPGTKIGVTYVLDSDRMIIYIAGIARYQPP